MVSSTLLDLKGCKLTLEHEGRTYFLEDVDFQLDQKDVYHDVGNSSNLLSSRFVRESELKISGNVYGVMGVAYMKYDNEPKELVQKSLLKRVLGYLI